MEMLKIPFAVALGASLALFALQNIAPVQLTILVWAFDGRRILVIGISLLVGIVIGCVICAVRHRRTA